MNAQDQLVSLLDRHARVSQAADGRFTLASGESSSVYFDGKRVTQSYEGMPLVGQVVWEFAKEIGAEAVGGLAVGSIPISDAAVAYATFTKSRPPLLGFYVLDAAKAHGTKEQVYQSYTEDGKELLTEGARVLIVDDVMTTGGSIKYAIEKVRERGAEVLGVLVLIDRGDPRAEAIRNAAPHFRAVAELDQDGSLKASPSVLATASSR